jgi:hypothetical protein
MMNFNGSVLDLSGVEPSTGGGGQVTIVPAGTYTVVCTEVRTHEMASGQGMGLIAKFQIIEGELSGKEISDFFTIRHDRSEPAQRIGQQKVRSWLDALGMPPALDFSQLDNLTNKPIVVDVSVGKGKPKNANDPSQGHYENNNVNAFHAPGNGAHGNMGSAAAPPPTQAPNAPAPAAQAAAVQNGGAPAAGAMPWRR